MNTHQVTVNGSLIISNLSLTAAQGAVQDAPHCVGLELGDLVEIRHEGRTVEHWAMCDEGFVELV